MKKIFILSGLFISFFINPFMKASNKKVFDFNPNETKLDNNHCNEYRKIGLYKLQEFALENNRNLLNTKLNIQSAKDIKNYHRKSLLPKFSITGNIDKAIDEWTEVNATNKEDSSSSEAFVLSSTDTNTLSAEINWSLLNPTIYSNIKAANHDLKETKYFSQTTYNELLKNVRLASINVDQQINNIKSTQDSIKRAKKLLEISKAQLESGFITVQDFLRQKNQSFAYEKELNVNLLSLKTSLNNLNLLINNNYNNCPLVAFDSNNYIKNKKNKIVSTESDLIFQAFENRSDLKSIEEKINAKKARLQYYRRANLPNTNLYLSATIYESDADEKISHTDRSETDTFYNDISIGLTSTSTFSAGQNNSMIRSIKSEIKTLENQFLDLKDSIRININNLLLERDTINRQDIIFKKQLNSAERTYNAIEIAFAKGYSSMSEVLDAQRSLSNSEKDLIINESNKAKNLVNLLRQLSISDL